MQHTIHDVGAWIGQDLVGVDGRPVGKIKDVYLDASTEQPEWLAVKTGGFGSGVSFVPLAEAEAHGDSVRVPYAAATIEAAPTVKPDGELTQDEEARLYDHYGLVYGESRSGSGLPEYEDDPIEVPVERVVPVEQAAPPAPPPPVQQAPLPPSPAPEPEPEPEPEPVGHDVSGPTTDNAMTRSEEELHVGAGAVPVGRARLRKHVVTEHVETTVPVQREEVRLEREPITDVNVADAMDGPAISEEEHEVVLHEEEVVVEKRVVPKERVRLDKQVVTDEQEVTDEIRKEQIEVDGVERARVS